MPDPATLLIEPWLSQDRPLDGHFQLVLAVLIGGLLAPLGLLLVTFVIPRFCPRERNHERNHGQRT